MLYGHDTGMNLSSEAWDCIFSHQYHLVSLDATMGKKQIAGYHMGLEDDLSFVKQLMDHGCADKDTVKVINHFSHNGEMTHEQLDAFANEHGMKASYDGMKVKF